jgi:hypothetical protein
MDRASWRERVLEGQGAYYICTGLWPLVHMASFEAVTGPKLDDWLVRMVGLLAAAIGATLGLAGVRTHGHLAEIVLLSTGAATAFFAIDVWYVLAGRISPIYLADALAELVLLAAVALTPRRAVP